MCLKRIMMTPCQNTNHMITQLILKRVNNPHYDPSIICHKMKLWRFENTWMKILIRGSLNIPNLQMMFQSYLSKKKDNSLWMCIDYCSLNWPTIKNYSKWEEAIIIFSNNFGQNIKYEIFTINFFGKLGTNCLPIICQPYS